MIHPTARNKTHVPKKKMSSYKGIHYFHTMKTGGTYMRQNLQKLCDLAGIELVCTSYDTGWLDDNKVRDDFLTIATVRDPLDMIASYWEYMKYSKTLYGKRDGGFSSQGWMLGRRPPFVSFSEFMQYWIKYADFQYMLENADSAWSYTMELGSFIRPNGIRRPHSEDGTRELYSPAEAALVVAAGFRPPPQYNDIKKSIIACDSVCWKSPSLDRPVYDGFSYFWYLEGKGRPEVAKLVTLRESPYERYDALNVYPDHPASAFVKSSAYLGWANWRKPFLDRSRMSQVPEIGFRKYFEIKSDDQCWDIFQKIWEYQLSPFYRLFRFDQSLELACCFDIIIKQENLNAGFDMLKNMFNVQFDSSKRVKVTHGRRNLNELLSASEINEYNNGFFKKERSLFGYDDPERHDEALMFGSDVHNFFHDVHPKKITI